MEEKDLDIQLLEIYLKLEADLKELKTFLSENYGFNFQD